MTNPGPPTVVKHYQLVRQIGSGGMSDVFLATDRRDGSEVVVKLLRNVVGDDDSYRERFEREAHVGALLRSPFTVHLLDFGRTAEGQYFLVTEYVDGGSLQDALRNGPMEPRRAVRIAAQVARALEEAQARGVIHRDIKPANVMLTANDGVKVLDFGIARQEGALTITMPGSFVGTANYAAPEASLGETDMRSDIYSLGATLYHMLAGQPPFSGDLLQVLRQHREATVNLNALQNCPEELIDIIRKCLAKNPEERYQSASQLAGAIEHASRATTNPPVPIVESGPTVIESPGAAASQPLLAPDDLPSESVTSARPLPPEPATAYTMVRPPAAPVTPAGPGTSASDSMSRPPVPVELSLHAVPGSRSRYELQLRHGNPAPLHLMLSASGAGLRFELPGSVLAQAGTTKVPLVVQPAKRRMAGGARSLPFAVHASGSGAEPTSAHASYADQPSTARLIVPVAGGVALLAAAAISVPLVLSGGGDDAEGEENTPTATTTSTSTAVATATTTAVPTTAAGETELAFVVNQDHFARSGPDGTNVAETDVRGFNTNWSADGAAVVYEANLTGNFEVWLTTKDSPEAVNVSNHASSDSQPAISPDGRRVAYTAARDGNAELYLQELGGGAPVNVTKNPATEAQAAWSPDGTRIAFVSDRDGNFEVYVMNADGTNLRNISNSAGRDFQPQWSPDGARIAYYTDRDGNWEVYAANPDGTGVTRLTTDPAKDEQPTFAPDGRVLFVSDRSGKQQIHSMAADGSDAKQLTNVPTGAAWPRVIPKGAVVPGKPAAASTATASPAAATVGAQATAPPATTSTRAPTSAATPPPPTATPTATTAPQPSMAETQFCMAAGCFPPGSTVNACNPSGMTGYATYTNMPAGSTIVVRWARAGVVLNETSFSPDATSGEAFADLFGNDASPLVPGTYFLTWMRNGLALATGTITLAC
ncbi:MAG: PD40 domain-containing protein [Dehalococcoidia bacterium]|nr:PD40 domain-containing protein [Dehalococcoidia bacterium]